MYLQDADAIVIDPGVITAQGAELGSSVEGEDSGAFKIGASEVVIESSGPMNLGFDRTSGYAASWMLGRAAFLTPRKRGGLVGSFQTTGGLPKRKRKSSAGGWKSVRRRVKSRIRADRPLH